MIDVDGDPGPGAQHVAKVERLLQRVEAGAVARVHGVERFERDRDLAGQGVRQQGGEAVGHHAAGRGEILGRARQAPDHHHEAVRAQCRRFVDGPPVVVDRCGQPGRIARGEHAAPAEPSDA